MKKIVLSTLLAVTLGTVSASAGMKFYTDANGQLFVTPGKGRTELNVNPQEVMDAMQTASKTTKSSKKMDILAKDMTSLKEDVTELKEENKVLKKKSTSVFAKADKLKFSGLTYIGFTNNARKKTISTGPNATKSESNFELRRSYFQLKAYLLEDPKSYFRVTMDMSQNTAGDLAVRAKYAYLYLNDVLPNTGVELGLVHRPWHDYEEHNAWYYRNISKVLVEAKNGGDLSNSADFGFNLKTKTQYLDTEIGVFNGEGYHSDFNDKEATNSVSVSNGMSLEWRATTHLMGENGKDKQTKKTYADASFFGQYNKAHKASGSGIANQYDDLIFMGFHTVYNQPSFLLSAQYITSLDTANNSTYISAQAGDGYSVNGEYRFGHDYDYRAIARYDSWTDKKIAATPETDNTAYILGGAWEQNKNVQWVANVIVTDNDKGSARENENGTQYMLTAEVKF
ncbi:hypothetical protein JHD48_03250 [Sulfurimonas sp. SAG-AH-194-I05]|nr:hypothetical protein [Sulfurimonas sp. SAG-AH-194-I05]MDF1874750.1 hypothetical protein [Sulfurimonas sp. SAG-AH-194-I05]